MKFGKFFQKETAKTKEVKKEKEKEGGYFIYERIPGIPGGQIGVVKSYGQEVLQQFKKIMPNMKKLEKVRAGGWRKKYVGQIETKNGPLKFIVKQKANPKETKSFCVGPSFKSVIHEIIINLDTRARYKKKYRQELLIEKPIGFFITKSGDRFIINEYIENAELVPWGNEQVDKFVDKINKRLNEIGIYPGDFSARHLLCQKIGRKNKFWIIDTELWQRFKNQKREPR